MNPNDPNPTKIIVKCICCMGTGSHEQYDPRYDIWTTTSCIPCHGTGKMTVKEIDDFINNYIDGLLN